MEVGREKGREGGDERERRSKERRMGVDDKNVQ